MSENKQLTKKPSIISTFLGGCYRGFEVGIKNIVPAMILGYTLVYILQATGVMDLLGSVLSPVMGVFGLPGEAVAVLISAFFAKAAGCGTAATMLFPACILMGTLIGHYARIVLVADADKKWHGLLLAVPLFDAVISLFMMKIILTFMGIE